MRRSTVTRWIARVSLATVAAVGCRSDELAAPMSPSTASRDDGGHDDDVYPGARGHAVACAPRAAAAARRTIGRAGGTLSIGASRLVVPRGALQRETVIVASVRGDTTSALTFGPTGLRFATPVTLVIDVDRCTIDRERAPVVEYVDHAGVVRERIPAAYGPGFHTVTAPITHFSAYQVAY